MHFDLPLMRITTGRMGIHEMVAGPIAAFPVFVRNDTIVTKAICKGRLKAVLARGTETRNGRKTMKNRS